MGDERPPESPDGAVVKFPVLLVMLGAPGAGKGTQAREIANWLCVPHISTGEMLRDAVERGTVTGKRVRAIMESGALVPDDLVCTIVEQRLSQPDCERGFILDGFPRSVHQALFLDGLLKSTHRGSVRVVNIRVDRDSVLKRLTGRRMCPKCGAIYNIYFNPPRRDSVCDLDGSSLVQRGDDTEEAVGTRLREYERQTKPLIERYRHMGALRAVDGNADPKTVREAIVRVLKAS